VLGSFEMVGYFLNWPRHPGLGAIAALGSLAYMLWMVYRLRPRMKALALATQGERAVGQFLEGFRGSGYRVFHDVPGDGFNVDHVLIGPTGVYTIETKTWSIPEHGSPTIQFDGEILTASGHRPDRDPIVQAKAQSSWLSRLLHESTGRRYSVRPVVLFPGWYVKQARGTTREVWVLHPRALPGFLRRTTTILSPEEIAMARAHLSRYVRTFKPLP